MTGGNNHNGYTIKRIDSSNIADMDKLYETVYGRRPAAGYYEKKLATDYTSIEHAGFIAYNTNWKPVASLCLVPCYVLYEGKRLFVAQLTDGMTDPAERKKGLFSNLEKEIIELAKKAGIQLIIGFPNQDSAPTLIKIGWQRGVSMERFEIWVKHWLPGFIVSIVNRVKRNANNATLVVAGCASSVLKDGFAGIQRSTDYLKYKSFTKTGVHDRGTGKAWIKTGYDLSIGDMEIEESEFDEMINSLQAVARKTGAKKIYFQSSPGTHLHSLFSKKYEPVPSFPVVFKNIGLEIQTDKFRFTLADIDIF